MFKMIIFLVAVSVVVTGCANVEVYTFKKERVDQGAKGNEGYLSGEVTTPKEGTATKKRTLIGIDIELKSKDKGETVEETISETVVEETDTVVEVAPMPDKSTSSVEQQVETVVIDQEEEWVK
jgi:hypothetical protein